MCMLQSACLQQNCCFATKEIKLMLAIDVQIAKPDMRAVKMMRQDGAVPHRTIGHPRGIKPGDRVEGRGEMDALAIHNRPVQVRKRKRRRRLALIVLLTSSSASDCGFLLFGWCLSTSSVDWFHCPFVSVSLSFPQQPMCEPAIPLSCLL